MNEFSRDDEKKQDQLKQIVSEIHQGKDIEYVKKKFAALIKNVSPEEISAMENSLLQEGVPPEQIQSLCEVHVDVFESALKKHKNPRNIPGHPLHTYLKENETARDITKRLNRLLKKGKPGQTSLYENLAAELEKLKEINLHYQRKENQLFPLLEAAKFDGPTKVMWGKHDEIRDKLKEFNESIQKSDWDGTKRSGNVLIGKINKMIFMEEKILFPTSLRKLPESDWVKIKEGEGEIGYAWVTPGNLWDVNIARSRTRPAETPSAVQEAAGQDIFHLEEGNLTIDQVNLLLKHLPLDVTFVDENDKVRYYSQGKERIFPRSPAIIGRDVRNCHPPKSLQTVKRILDGFKKKEKSSADFWINVEDRLIYIRYFAIYDPKGAYRGVIEVSQDVTDIKTLTGERKLLDW